MRVKCAVDQAVVSSIDFAVIIEVAIEPTGNVSGGVLRQQFRLWYGHWLGGKLTLLHRYAEARQPLLDALAYLQANGGQSENIRGVMQMLADGYESTGDAEQSRKWRRDANTYHASATTRSTTATQK